MTGVEGSVLVRPADDGDRDWVIGVLETRWGSAELVSRGRRYAADELPTFVGEVAGARSGLATYCFDDDEAELVTLDALSQGNGIGSALLAAVIDAARDRDCRRLRVITTNDNLDAIRFYQRRGLRIVAVHSNAVDAARAIKPQIPDVGCFGIPLHDEIELAINLR
jgi:ribosomal protein S18 acetylase RimI-like enzyme